MDPCGVNIRNKFIYGESVLEQFIILFCPSKNFKYRADSDILPLFFPCFFLNRDLPKSKRKDILSETVYSDLSAKLLNEMIKSPVEGQVSINLICILLTDTIPSQRQMITTNIAVDSISIPLVQIKF